MNAWLDDLQPTTLNKAELCEQLAQTMGLSQREARELVDGFFDVLGKQLVQGEQVKLANFGTFRILKKSARPGRNLRTAQQVQIEARRAISFLSGPKLRAQLQAAADTTEESGSAVAEQGLALRPVGTPLGVDFVSRAD